MNQGPGARIDVLSQITIAGSLIVAISVEKCHLHQRIALKALVTIGTSPRLLMLGLMLPTMFLSMWISNTATTAMMLPIVDAVAEAINSKVNNKQKYLQTTLYYVCQSDKESYRAVAKR